MSDDKWVIMMCSKVAMTCCKAMVIGWGGALGRVYIGDYFSGDCGLGFGDGKNISVKIITF